MCNLPLTAIDETGTIHSFEQDVQEGRTLLTLRKETIAHVKTLRVLPDLAKAQAGDAGFYLAPRGIQYDGDLLVPFTAQEDAEFSYGQPIMSCYGVRTPQVSALVRLERNYKYAFHLSVKGGEYRLESVFDFTDNDPVYEDIRIEILWLKPDAQPADMARAERNIRLKRGEIIPLSDKCRRSAVEYARRHPLVRIRMGWKPSPSPVAHQTVENEPEMYTACTFARVREIADAFHAGGVEGAEFQLVGWNISGHDGRYPQIFPVDDRLGGIEEMRKTIAHLKALGYRVSVHTNSIDAYEIADSFSWDDIVVKRDGSYNQTGKYSAGDAYHICQTRQIEIARRDLPAVQALDLDGLHYIDVISIVVPDSCHSEAHPCSTRRAVELAQETMRYASSLFGGLSSEGCMDFSLGALDYGLYVSFGSAFKPDGIPIALQKYPFFELTYHGILLYNPISPTVNYPIKTPKDRLTFLLRGGRPSFYLYSKFRAAGQVNWMGEDDLVADDEETLARTTECVAQAARLYSGLCDLQLVYMCDYKILENGIHVASYEDGTRIAGNFTDHPVSLCGETIEAWGYSIHRG